ncbi:uncharacterized protein FFB20_14219 [Fusarium fujikuroi]|nr:uncharacterized protein FFC1_05652 [Fusarium fujikuroi]SCN93512.1 uncharacterized protein FFE2_07745 [Fusarium fujikuroi]SCO13288.1 uncharacterized protein FFB20_14219 [Fusarium fujikuroi]SCO22041.1 uncharacterized protein FFM5_12850 [Fusarium fujikuroi]SCO41878.1 uncharacterized protein FFNC_08198 [Fusarium fujikuroi]
MYVDACKNEFHILISDMPGPPRRVALNPKHGGSQKHNSVFAALAG